MNMKKFWKMFLMIFVGFPLGIIAAFTPFVLFVYFAEPSSGGGFLALLITVLFWYAIIVAVEHAKDDMYGID